MKAKITWIGARNFVGESGTGHAVVLGASPAPGQAGLGASPMELVLIGMGGCTAFDVVNILEKGREAIEDCTAELDATRADTDPKVFTKIHVHFVVKGRTLSREKVGRAIQLSADKYCSASAMIAKTATITHDFEIVETGRA